VAAGNPDPPDWVTLAGDFGFADQPHLAREFKAFSGLTPTDYLDATNNSP
jgi:AraC-like DNA-binding protein